MAIPYILKDFSQLKGLEAVSDKALDYHFGLYDGYVKNFNKILDKLSAVAGDSPEYAELKRRLGWEFNGARLHELYFGNLKKGGSALDKNSALYQKITEDFGSWEDWQKDFMTTAKIRGIGWAVLYFDRSGDRLLNSWINEHDGGHPAGGAPLLVVDVFEHAFLPDFGTNRAGYVEAITKVLNWDVASERFAAALM